MRCGLEQQLVESALWSTTARIELAVFEPDELFDLGSNFSLSPSIFSPSAEVSLSIGAVVQHDGGHGPGAVLGDEGELDVERRLTVTDQCLTTASFPGLLGVEGDAERLDDRGLPGARVADDGEQVEGREVEYTRARGTTGGPRTTA